MKGMKGGMDLAGINGKHLNHPVNTSGEPRRIPLGVNATWPVEYLFDNYSFKPIFMMCCALLLNKAKIRCTRYVVCSMQYAVCSM